MTFFAAAQRMTTAEQTEDNLMLLHSKSHAYKKLFSTMSDVCEALIVFSVYSVYSVVSKISCSFVQFVVLNNYALCIMHC